MNDHGLEQMVHFPTREKNTLDLILTTLPGQFQDVHSPDKLSDHDVVSGTLKIFIPPIKKPRRKVYLYQKIYEKRHTWVCKGKILQWSLGYSFSTHGGEPTSHNVILMIGSTCYFWKSCAIRVRLCLVFPLILVRFAWNLKQLPRKKYWNVPI